MNTPRTKGFIESLYMVLKGYRVPAQRRFNTQRVGEYLNGKLNDSDLSGETIQVLESFLKKNNSGQNCRMSTLDAIKIVEETGQEVKPIKERLKEAQITPERIQAISDIIRGE